MKPIFQEDELGCGVACTAFILGISYQDALSLFEDGKSKADNAGFYCKEICKILMKNYKFYEFKYIKPKNRYKMYKSNSIVFVKRSKKYKYGHFLARHDNTWMDPWINFPKYPRKSGFRKRIPGKPIYIIFKNI